MAAAATHPTESFCRGGCPSGYEGAQFGLIQGLGSISQTFTSQAGSHQLAWLDANRIGYGNDHAYQVSVDGTVVGTYTPSYTFAGGNKFHKETLDLANLTAGSHVLAFTATVAGDGTAFIDDVKLGVTEAAAWAMMLIVVAGLGAMLRRRRLLAA